MPRIAAGTKCGAEGNPEAIDPLNEQLSKLHHRFGGLRRIALPHACASTRPLCEANRGYGSTERSYGRAAPNARSVAKGRLACKPGYEFRLANVWAA